MPNVLQEAVGDVLTQAECDFYGIAGGTGRMHVCMGDKRGAQTGACNVCYYIIMFSFECCRLRIVRI